MFIPHPDLADDVTSDALAHMILWTFSTHGDWHGFVANMRGMFIDFQLWDDYKGGAEQLPGRPNYSL